MSTGIVFVVVLNMALALAGLIVGVESLVAIKRTRLQVRRLLVSSMAGVKAERRETIGKLRDIQALCSAPAPDNIRPGLVRWYPNGKAEDTRCACGEYDLSPPILATGFGDGRRHTRVVCDLQVNA